MWPWSEFIKQRKLIDHYEAVVLQHARRADLFRAEYLAAMSALRGAHKGIWRLRQKLKKYEQGGLKD